MENCHLGNSQKPSGSLVSNYNYAVHFMDYLCYHAPHSSLDRVYVVSYGCKKANKAKFIKNKHGEVQVFFPIKISFFRDRIKMFQMLNLNLLGK